MVNFLAILAYLLLDVMLRLQLDAYLNSCTQYELNLYFKVTFQYNYQGFNISEKFSLFDKILCMFLLAMRHSEFKKQGKSNAADELSR